MIYLHGGEMEHKGRSEKDRGGCEDYSKGGMEDVLEA